MKIRMGKYPMRDLINLITEAQLGDYIRVTTSDPDADFWIERRGSAQTVGRPSRTYLPHGYGITVTDRSRILPDYLYYVFEHLFRSHAWEKIAHGATSLVNLKKGDIEGIALREDAQPENGQNGQTQNGQQTNQPTNQSNTAPTSTAATAPSNTSTTQSTAPIVPIGAGNSSTTTAAGNDEVTSSPTAADSKPSEVNEAVLEWVVKYLGEHLRKAQ
jgi:hypothetical protein